MPSAIIVEDEVLASERLRLLLEECKITLLASFRHAAPALEWLTLHEVDIVFTDIGLREMDGMAFVQNMRRVSRSRPAVIFTTAFEEHALKAFELGVADYLLKPVKLVRLQAALSRLALAAEEGFTEFHLHTSTRLKTLPWQKARYLQADEKIVVLVDDQGQEHLLPKTLIYWEQLLGDKVVRVHRNALVFRHVFDGLVRLEEETPEGARWAAKVSDSSVLLPVSRRQLSVLRREFELNEFGPDA